MTKRYLSAVVALYGDKAPDSTSARIGKGSFSHGQKKRPARRIEQGIQMRLVAWLLSEGLEVVQIGNEGKRSRIGGHIAKQMGLRPGASDLFFPYCRNGYGGYWIELKQPGETPRANQYEFLEKMRANGYRTGWFDDWEKARDSIREYMNNGRI